VRGLRFDAGAFAVFVLDMAISGTASEGYIYSLSAREEVFSNGAP
jgi:hypothetical protein